MLRTMICLLLLSNLSQAAGPPSAQVAKLTSGTVVIVRLVSGEEIRGRFQSLTPDALEVMTAAADTIDTRRIPIRDVKSIRLPTHRVRDTFAVLGGIFLFYVVADGIVYALQ